VLDNNATPFEHKRRNRQTSAAAVFFIFARPYFFAYVVVNETLIMRKMVSRHPQANSNREL
jgi:hypothetical protein